jgi:hypothetical protein
MTCDRRTAGYLRHKSQNTAPTLVGKRGAYICYPAAAPGVPPGLIDAIVHITSRLKFAQHSTNWTYVHA